MKIPVWVKQTISTVVLVAAMLAWFALYYVPAKIDSETRDLSNDVSSLKTDVADVKGNIQRIDSKLEGLLKDLVDSELKSLKGVSRLPSNIASDRLSFVASIVGRAQEAGVRADPSVVADAGNSALEASVVTSLRPVAWKASQQLLDYRSYLTPKPAPPPSAQSGPPSKMWSTGVLPFTITSLTVYSFTTHRQDMAVFERFGEGRTQNVPNGPSLISFNGAGGNLQIDNHMVRNAIFSNLHIIYKGGKLDLKNVLFVDCTFDISSGPPQAVSFARALFQSTPTNFTS
jgi:hypothetical protein